MGKKIVMMVMMVMMDDERKLARFCKNPTANIEEGSP